MNQKRFEEIKNDKRTTKRAIKTILKAIEDGYDFSDNKKMLELVFASYQVGKPRTLVYITKNFKRAYEFLKRELY